MAEDPPTILRGADGAPQHVVLSWAAYQALVEGSPPRDTRRAPPSAVRARLEEGATPVRAWREHRGMSQAALAGAVGISRAYLTQIETGLRIGTVEVLARLAKRLGCLIEDLIASADEATQAKLDRLAAMPETVDRLVASIAREAWTAQPGPDRFSLVQHVCHLRDVDGEAYRVRIERILAEEKPALADFDGTRVAEDRDYQRQDLIQAAHAFRRGRARIVEGLGRLTPAMRRRVGVQEGLGEVSIEDVIEAMLAHDAEHRDELAEFSRTADQPA